MLYWKCRTDLEGIIDREESILWCSECFGVEKMRYELNVSFKKS